MPNRAGSAGAVAIDGGELGLGGGLLALLRPALELLAPGGVVAVRSTAAALRQDLSSWCRLEAHEYLGCETQPDGDRHLIARGTLGVPRGPSLVGEVPMPALADPATGFAPRGARVEPGGPVYPFTLLAQGLVAPPEVAELYRQATAAQWQADDIAWHEVRPLPAPLERALGQVMTFLAENELSALYVPARFLPRIHPAYLEVAQFLATQLGDEARHIAVFLRRARAGGGGLGVSAATTSRSLLSLLELEDFSEATFLLSVLGEGTFLDLLRYVEDHAPDRPTADLVRRARADESRHVHFGLAHTRHALACDPGLGARLEAAVARRAAQLAGGGVPAPLQDALVILAARGIDPPSVARGHDAFRQLLDDMDAARVKRLLHAGFAPEQAARLSALQTPNFM